MVMYRSLYNSVREHGLMWEEHPIEVNGYLHLLDGAHRVAMALAFQQRQVTLLQTCSHHRVLPMTFSYLKVASPALLLMARTAVAGLLGGDADCRWHECTSSTSATAW